MNVLILSSSHPQKMSGIVAYDLYQNLKKIPDNQVCLLIKPFDSFDDPGIVSIQTSIDYFFFRIKTRLSNEISKVFPIIRKKKEITDTDYCMFEPDETKTFYSTTKILSRVTFKPDVVLVLFMASFISYKNLYQINRKTKAPIFIYMMDMAPMTGGCHYAWDCVGYKYQCGKCPALFSNIPEDQSRKNWKFRKHFVDKTNVLVISGTEHQFRQLQESSIFKFKQKEKILLSVNSQIFFPSDSVAARKHFNLPENMKIVFFGAVSISERRKGFRELISALKILKQNAPDLQIHLAIAGKADKLLLSDLSYNYTELGYLPYPSLAKAFNASDVFLCPSIEDSGPMMINQSVMCGTPVVAFEMGVALDLVINNKTGYMARISDSEDLAFGLKKILSLHPESYSELKTNCLSLSEKLLNHNNYIQKFDDILKQAIKKMVIS